MAYFRRRRGGRKRLRYGRRFRRGRFLYKRRRFGTRPEVKQLVYDLTATFSSVGSAAWTELNLSNTTQAITSTGRIGNKIRLKSVQINFVYTSGAVNSATDDAYNIMRCVLGIYNRNNSATMAGLQTWAPGLSNVITKYTQSNLRHKFMDKLLLPHSAGQDSTGYIPLPKQLKYFKRFKNTYLTWSDNTGNYPDKDLILSLRSDSGAVPNPGILTGYACVRYTDV